jgi:hypothetical protein
MLGLKPVEELVTCSPIFNRLTIEKTTPETKDTDHRIGSSHIDRYPVKIET